MDTMNTEALRMVKNQLNKIVKIACQGAELIMPKILFAPKCEEGIVSRIKSVEACEEFHWPNGETRLDEDRSQNASDCDDCQLIAKQ